LNLKKFLLPYFYASVIAALDLYIKYLIRTYNIQEKVIIENFLTIDLNYNTGIAFGLFS
jgi:lipoprotein signal peptidase